ncbi:MAG: hypothetical protein Q7K57_54640 [Burkholderiaceae bacterium]|nr:hypothetical protein [Burkholderiaceae bacterium]
MRLGEIFQPQSASRRKRSDGTVAEVFIIESLTLTDETKERHEGAVLAAVLKMCGKKPLYYYIRTRAELEHLAEEFEASGYRYLHVSCHGGDGSLETTLDSISYADFAKIFSNRLAGRRLFVSACSAGNESFAELIHGKNSKAISVAAPVEEIRFDHAVAFWCAFYTKAFSINAKYMNSDHLLEVLQPLATLFNAPMHFSRVGKNKKWAHEVIEG